MQQAPKKPQSVVLKFEGGPELRGHIHGFGLGARLLSMLPLELHLSRWGDEYFGPCGIHSDCSENATEAVPVGALAYWPPGDALCIFFGPTPASCGSEPRAASPVCVVGSIQLDADSMRCLPQQVNVVLQKEFDT